MRASIERIVKQLASLAQGEGAKPHTTEILRAVKGMVLNALEDFVALFGREGVHNFLLPYLITFMNDTQWEIRAKFCAEMHKIIPTIGRVSTEGIVWPCYEQALLDNEGRVVVAALHGIEHMVKQTEVVFKRLFRLSTVVDPLCPLLLHPNAIIRNATIRVFHALNADAVEFHAFLLPKMKPFVLHLQGFDCIENASWRPPLSKKIYDLLTHRVHDVEHVPVPIIEEARKALLLAEPLPEVNADYEADFKALDLMRKVLFGALHAPRRTQVETRSVEKLQTQRIPFVSLHANSAIHPLMLLASRTYDPLPKPTGQYDWRVHVLRLPAKPRQLGTLTRLDGTPFSLYPYVSYTPDQSDFRTPENLSCVQLSGTISLQGESSSLRENFIVR